MDTNKTMQKFGLEEISFAELNTVKGGNFVAVAGLIIGGFKLAMDASYSIGYAIGYYSATHN